MLCLNDQHQSPPNHQNIIQSAVVVNFVPKKCYEQRTKKNSTKKIKNEKGEPKKHDMHILIYFTKNQLQEVEQGSTICLLAFAPHRRSTLPKCIQSSSQAMLADTSFIAKTTLFLLAQMMQKLTWKN